MENTSRLPYQTIFVALDGSEHQDFVLERAAAIARAYHAHLVIGHVVDSTTLETASTYPADLLNSLQMSFTESVSHAVDTLNEDHDIAGVEVMVKAGRVRETLKEDMLDIVKPDLIVCGARGLSSIKYALLGSISTFLARYTKCDTLVVK